MMAAVVLAEGRTAASGGGRWWVGRWLSVYSNSPIVNDDENLILFLLV